LIAIAIGNAGSQDAINLQNFQLKEPVFACRKTLKDELNFRINLAKPK
jgi:hypothetical protein